MGIKLRSRLQKVCFGLMIALLVMLNPISAQAAPAYAIQPLTTLEFSSTDINSVAVYETGNKVFVGDAANNAIIVLNGETDEVITTITGVPEGGGGGLIVNETYGKVYFYTNTNTGVLDAVTHQILSLSLPEGYLIHDEVNDKLYILGGGVTDYTIDVLDIATDTSTFLYTGSGNSHGGVINTTTNELAVLIYYPARIDFINVNTVAVNSFDIVNAGGDHALDLEVNTLENKYYATLITMPGQGEMGIFILDRDTNVPKFVGASDLEPLVFNPASNTLFSGVQVGTSMGVIDGATDEFTSIDVRSNGHGGHGAAQVRYATDHAYFVAQNEIARIDKFKTVDFIPTPVEIEGGAVGSSIAINQSTGKVYVISDNRVGKVFVLQDPPSQGVGAMVKDGGFEGGAPNPYWMEYASAGYYYDIPLICDIVTCGVDAAHTGSSWAMLGGWADETHLSQTGILPTNVSTLSFWLCIPFAGTWKNTDYLILEIDGNILFTISGNSAPSYSTYKKVSVNISDYADGGVHKIRFNSFGTIDGSVFYVDDVALNAAPISQTFTSTASQDGWLLEKSETGNIGGSLNPVAATFQLGDDAANRQYRAILSFNTAGLPDNASIKSAQLKIKQSGAPVGKNPFTVLGSLWADIRQGPFSGNAILQLGDFNAPASAVKVGAFNKTPVGGWYTDTLNAVGLAKINKTGQTQFRLYFATDDNNNRLADFMKFVSGNGLASSRPVLVITYTVP